MKKDIFYKVLFGLLGLLIVFILVNQWDAAPPENIFTFDDLLPVSYEKENGFYLVLALNESPDVDINSDAIITKYRGLYDPQFDNAAAWKAFDYPEYRTRFDGIQRRCRFLHGSFTDWTVLVGKKRGDIETLSRELSVYLDRYRELLTRDMVRDISVAWHWVDGDALLTTARLYTALAVMENMDNAADGVAGDTPAGVAGLGQFRLGLKIAHSARSPHLGFVGKELMQISLQALTNLMNQPDCPRGVFSRVLTELPPLTPETFNSRNAFIGLFLGYDRYYKNVLDKQIERGNVMIGKRLGKAARLFLLEQRTINYYFSYFSRCIELEDQPPWQWRVKNLTPEEINKGNFWWIHNPTGKLLFSKKDYLKPNLTAEVAATVKTRILYDLTRICAELHLRYTGETPVPELLKQLEKENKNLNVTDPYSGNRYLWNEAEKVLYSVGPDRKDDKGVFDPAKHTVHAVPDIITPCIL